VDVEVDQVDAFTEEDRLFLERCASEIAAARSLPRKQDS
jgi:putative methionine-R-sulfoxide reductase with GAF domain